jgi:hypothetical protein
MVYVYIDEFLLLLPVHWIHMWFQYINVKRRKKRRNQCKCWLERERTITWKDFEKRIEIELPVSILFNWRFLTLIGWNFISFHLKVLSLVIRNKEEEEKEKSRRDLYKHDLFD